jgi:arylsulfatase
MWWSDAFPTVTRLCGGKLPANPIDGIDIWPLLSGQVKSIDREVLLYFDNWDLQCAKWMNWKLHIARHNSSTYSAMPACGRHNYVLTKPELYKLADDPQESDDVSTDHPDIVAEIQRRVAPLLEQFPEPVKTAYAESKARPYDPLTPTGARPRPTGP